MSNCGLLKHSEDEELTSDFSWYLCGPQAEIMYAVVSIGGQQFKVSPERYIYVNRLEASEGEAVTFDQVHLIAQENDVKVGAPVITGARVHGKVLAHVKGDKVLVFKKKRRKGYQKMNGHRQQFTQVLIESITA